MTYEINEAIPILKKLLSKEKLNIFVGSGISIDSGIPNWDGMIDSFLKMASEIKFSEDKDKEDVNKLFNLANQRKGNQRFNPIEIATVLRGKLDSCDEIHLDTTLAFNTYKNWLSETFHSKKYNSKHKIITATNYPFILTSNYDPLLENAAFDQGYTTFGARQSFDYKDETEILKAINNEVSSIFHVHGKSSKLEIKDLIFTKEDYNKIILKRYPGFSFALRILFSRYSTLFVGYGASDPHLEEVLEELSEYFPNKNGDNGLPHSFLVTLRDKNDLILEKYKERVGVNIILIDSYEQYEKLLEPLKNSNPRKIYEKRSKSKINRR